MGVSNVTITNILKRCGVKVRSLSEAMGGLTKEQEKEVCERYLQGETTVQLGAAMGVTPSCIARILKRRGVKARSNSEARGGLTQEQEKEVCERYLEGESAVQLGAVMGVSGSAIANALNRRGVKTRSLSEAKGGLAKEQEKEVCERYLEGESTVQLGAAMGVNDGTIGRILKRRGVKARSLSEAKGGLTKEQEKEVCERYLEGESTVQLGAAMGVSKVTIGAVLKRRGVKTGSLSEANGGLTKEQEEEVCERYLAGENTYQLGAAMGVATATIHRTLKRHGVKTRCISQAKGGLTQEQEEEVCKRYLAGETTVQLGAAMGVSNVTIGATLKRHGVKVRRMSEALGGLSLEQESEVCSRYILGESTLLLAAKMGVGSTTITRILTRNDIERRQVGGYSDSVQHSLDCTGHHSRIRDCDFYLISLARYSDTHCKPGIAFNVEARAAQSDGEYGKEHFRVTFATRQEAFFLEQALLDATCGAATCPEDLRDWQGATEVRAIPPEEMLPIAERLIDEMQELGIWDFASLRVPMTMEQRAICQQRALAAAPVIAVVSAEEPGDY